MVRASVAEALRQPRLVGAAAALADGGHGRLGAADPVPDDGVLRQRHQHDRRRNLVALQLAWQALPVPAFVDLAQADDQRVAKPSRSASRCATSQCPAKLSRIKAGQARAGRARHSRRMR